MAGGAGGVPDDRLDALQMEVIEELEQRRVATVSNARLRDGRTARTITHSDTGRASH
jgi:hypothetical protein